MEKDTDGLNIDAVCDVYMILVNDTHPTKSNEG